MIAGYIRVSTDKQDTSNQRFEILDYANAHKLGQVELLSESVSGRVSWQERELVTLINKLKKGDTLIVSELSRLGRSILEIFELISILLRNGVEVHVVKGNNILKDDIQSKVFTFAFSLGAEIERELISQRTKEALRRKVAEGVKLGRPIGSRSSQLDEHTAQILELREKGVSIASIAKIYGVSQTTVGHFLKTRCRLPPS
jgi:DNA invertase Pin-like site-specific DNA recombinase